MSIENIFPNKQQFDTINERLLEIANNVAGGSSKLDKPANPSAESAVTMLADGTVGTKPLSEIGGGGGGKLYMHNIHITYGGELSSYLYIVIYTSNKTLINTINKIEPYTNTTYLNCIYSSYDGAGAVQFQVNDETTFNLWGVLVTRGQDSVVPKVGMGITPEEITDTVIEV